MKKAIAIILSIMLVMAITFPTAALSSIAVKSIRLENSNITLKAGQTSNIKVTFTPANTSQKRLTYVTSDKYVASVDATGKITAAHPGTTNIYVYTINKKIFAKCKVTVDKIVKLTFSWWGGEERHKGTIAAITLWNKKNPAVQIEPIFSGYSGYMDKLMTQFIGKVAPDIFQLEADNLPDYIAKGLVADITQYKNTDFAGLDSFLWKFFKANGKNYAVASGINGPVLAYNKTKLEKLGIPLPTYKETWDSLLEKCKLATKDTDGDGKVDFWGIMDPLTWNTELMRFTFNEFGADLYTDDMKASNFDNPKIVAGLTKLSQFKKSKAVIPSDTTVNSQGDDYMLAGYVGFQPYVFSDYASTAGSSKDEIDIVPYPAGTVESRELTFGLPMALNNQCKHKAEAAAFLGWFVTSPDASRAMGSMLRGVFPSKAQRDAAIKDFTTDRILNQVLNVANFYNSLDLKNDKVQTVPVNVGEWTNIYYSILDQYKNNKITLEEMITQIKKNADPVLAK